MNFDALGHLHIWSWETTLTVTVIFLLAKMLKIMQNMGDNFLSLLSKMSSASAFQCSKPTKPASFPLRKTPNMLWRHCFASSFAGEASPDDEGCRIRTGDANRIELGRIHLWLCSSRFRGWWLRRRCPVVTVSNCSVQRGKSRRNGSQMKKGLRIEK